MYDFLNMLLRILDIVRLLSLLHGNNVWVSNCIVTIYREPSLNSSPNLPYGQKNLIGT